MITCQQLTELVTDYLEHRLSWPDHARFQFHLGICRSCRAYLAQMQTTVDALGRLPEQPTPEDVESEMLRRFRTWHEGRKN